MAVEQGDCRGDDDDRLAMNVVVFRGELYKGWISSSAGRLACGVVRLDLPDGEYQMTLTPIGGKDALNI